MNINQKPLKKIITQKLQINQLKLALILNEAVAPLSKTSTKDPRNIAHSQPSNFKSRSPILYLPNKSKEQRVQCHHSNINKSKSTPKVMMVHSQAVGQDLDQVGPLQAAQEVGALLQEGQVPPPLPLQFQAQMDPEGRRRKQGKIKISCIN